MLTSSNAYHEARQYSSLHCETNACGWDELHSLSLLYSSQAWMLLNIMLMMVQTVFRGTAHPWVDMYVGSFDVLQVSHCIIAEIIGD